MPKNQLLIVKIVIFLLILSGVFYILRLKSMGVFDDKGALKTTKEDVVYPDLSSETFTVEVEDDPVHGDILITPEGFTLYTFDKDSKNKSTCTGECAVNWPPFLVSITNEINAPSGVLMDLSTIQRDDGAMQLTYHGMPLYLYKEDTQAAMVNGHGFNDSWYVVKVENPYSL